MAKRDHVNPRKRPFQLKLKIAGAPVTARGRLPEIPIRVADFLPVLQQLSSGIAEAAEKREAREGREVSCKAGCGACCRQPVPIAPSEAIRLGERIEGFPADRRERILERFRAGMQKIRESGVLDEIEALEADASADQRRDVALRYFRLQVSCPFLENEQCSIHPDRPLACREYLVTSPAENCANPSADTVRMVPQPVRLSHLLFRFEDGKGESPTRTLLLMQALEHAELEHPGKTSRFSPNQLFESLAGYLQKKSGSEKRQPAGPAKPD